MVADNVEDIKGERLDRVISELSERYHSPADLRRHQSEALALSSVESFRSDYASLAEQARGLVHQIEMAILQDLMSVNSGGRWENQQDISIMCNKHGVPKVVATASLPRGMNALTHRFSHGDLTQSYHLERIIEGIVLCSEHQDEATEIVVSGSVSRIFSNPEKDPPAIVDSIATELASRHYPGVSKINGKFNQFRDEVRTALEIIFQVGEHGGLFDTLYEGLQQIRHRAVTSPFIAVTAKLDKLPASVKRILRHEDAANTNSQNQLAWHLRNSPFFKDLEDIAADYIPSPLVVMKNRIKGNESMSEKLVVSRHWDAVLEGYKSGKLQAHFKRFGLPKPRKPSETPPHLDDLATLEVLVHDDSLTYDWFDLYRKNFRLAAPEHGRLRKKIYGIFGQLAEVEELGYARHDLPVDRNGNKLKRRMPPNRERPRFAGEGVKVTGRGLVFWLDPAFGRFDDYALWAKDSGYMAIHATVGSRIEDLGNSLVEVHIKPNVISNYEKFAGDHFKYKQERAGVLHFLRSTGAVSPMEWEVVKLLWKPDDRPYRDTNVSLMKV